MQIIAKGAGFVPFNEAFGAFQTRKPSVDKLRNAFRPGFRGECRFDLTAKASVALGLIQHQLGKFLSGQLGQFFDGKRGLSSHGSGHFILRANRPF
nr:hypothetical protein [Falsiruegeria mediterranea]